MASRHDRAFEGFAPQFITSEQATRDGAQATPEPDLPEEPLLSPDHPLIEKSPFGTISWYTDSARSGRAATLIEMRNGNRFRMVHTAWMPRRTRGYIYHNDGTPTHRSLSFSIEYSPANRRNRVRIVRVGPYSGEIVNARLYKSRNASGSPYLPSPGMINTPGDYVLAALTSIGMKMSFWRSFGR